MVYQTANENVANTKQSTLKPLLRQLQNKHSSSFISPPWKTQHIDKHRFSSYDIWLEPAVTAYSFKWLCWNI